MSGYGGMLIQEPRFASDKNEEPVDDEFDMQQLQVGLKTTCERIGTESPGGSPEQKKKVPAEERPTPEEALLRCIQKVYQRNSKGRMQDQLQKWMLDFLTPKQVNARMFASKRDSFMCAQREVEVKFWSKYHVDVRKADSYHEKVYARKFPKWRANLREWSDKRLTHLSGMKIENIRRGAGRKSDFDSNPSSPEVNNENNLPVLGLNGLQINGSASDANIMMSILPESARADSEIESARSVRPTRDSDLLLRAFGLPDSSYQPAGKNKDDVLEKILLSNQKIANEDDNAESVQKKKENAARYRRDNKLQAEDYLSRHERSVASKPGKQLKHLSAQQVSNLSVSSYFRSCDNLGLVPKVPKSIVMDEKNDEEGVLASTMDLEGLEMGDQELESWSQALFGELNMLTERKKLKPGEVPNNVLNLMPATRVKVLKVGLNRFSDKALAKFLNGFLKNKKKVFELEDLSLHGLGMMSHLSIQKLSVILSSSMNFPKVQSLNMSGVSTLFSQRDLATMFCEGISKVGTLQDLKLVDTGLGLISQNTVIALGEALTDLPLKKLDISHNFVMKEGFLSLAKTVEEIQLEELQMNYNVDRPVKQEPASLNDDCAICYFLEKLCHQRKLETLGLRGSGLNYQTDLILAESLEFSENLINLDVGDNPHGKEGARCLLRLLMGQDCGVSNLSIGGGGGLREKYDFEHERFRFNWSDPNGNYNLNLERPSDRAVVKLLYSWGHYFKQKDTALSECTLDGASCGGLPVQVKDIPNGGTYRLVDPPKGRIKFKFRIETAQSSSEASKRAMQDYKFTGNSPVRKKQGTIDDGGPQTLIEYSKLKATLMRFVPLAQTFEKLTSDGEQRIMLAGMSYDLQLKLCHVKFFIEKAPLQCAFIVRTLYSCVNRTDAMQLVNMLPHASLQKAVRSQTSNAFFFNLTNPTGRYKLQIENPTDRNIVENLIGLDKWERKIVEQNPEIIDLSQYGDHSCLRNIVLNGKPFRPDDFKEHFTADTMGILELDYRTRLFTEQGNWENVTNPDIWEELLAKAMESVVSYIAKLRSFRQVSSLLTMNATFLRQFTIFFPKSQADSDWFTNDRRPDATENQYDSVVGGTFLDSDGFSCLRSDAFVMMWSRVVEPSHLIMTNTMRDRMAVPTEGDPEPDGILYDPAVFSRGEQRVVVSALGYLVAFDLKRVSDKTSNFGGWFQQDSGTALDLAIYEEWTIASMLIQLAAREGGDEDALVDMNWTGTKSTPGSEFVLPHTWIADLPKFGLFECQYKTDPPYDESIDWEFRLELGEKYMAYTEDLTSIRTDKATGKRLQPPNMDGLNP